MVEILGISDPQILIAYALSIGLAIACVVYGIIRYREGGDDDS